MFAGPHDNVLCSPRYAIMETYYIFIYFIFLLIFSDARLCVLKARGKLREDFPASRAEEVYRLVWKPLFWSPLGTA